MTNESNLPDDYPVLLEDLKKRIRASLAVNKELILLYWDLGNVILKRQNEQGCGTKVIDKLSKDLRAAFPGSKGYSTRNLKYMRSLAEAWPYIQIVQAVLSQIPWYHNNKNAPGMTRTCDTRFRKYTES